VKQVLGNTARVMNLHVYNLVDPDCNPTAFRRAFKRHCGITPSRMRVQK